MKYLGLTCVLLCVTFQLQCQSWSEIQKVIADDRASFDHFARSVAIYGDYAIIGSPQDDKDINGNNILTDAGSAYILRCDTFGTWHQEAKLVAPDRSAGDYFGISVAMEGPYAIVGAVYEDEDASGQNTLYLSGSAYIFEQDTNGNWSFAQKIVPADRRQEDYFGISVSIDGGYAVIGAQFSDYDAGGNNYLYQSGAAYVFKRDMSGVWNEQLKLLAVDRSANDYFGNAVAISGNYIIIGAMNESEDSLGLNTMSASGSAYIFRRLPNGNWIAEQKIVAGDRAAVDHFGSSVSISGDYLVVGAPFEDEDASGLNTFNNAGSAYIFEREGSGLWIEAEKIVATDRAGGEYFGSATSINGDYIIIGAYHDSEDNTGNNYIQHAGAAFVFYRDVTGNWIKAAKLLASDREEYAEFGCAVGISGKFAMVGAHNESKDINGFNPRQNSGAAYLFFGCGTKSTINVNACNDYTSPSGNHYWTQSGWFRDTLSNSLGCDSIININLVVQIIDTGLTDIGNALVANTNGALYQWLDCDNNYSIIPGQTSQSFSPGISGNYAVEINLNNCADTSECQYFTVTNYQEAELKDTRLWPNPCDGQLQLELPAKYEVLHIQILDLVGNVMVSESFTQVSKLNFELDFPPGYYLVRVSDHEAQTTTKRFILL